MRDGSSWKVVILFVAASMLGGFIATGGFVLYWKLQVPEPLRRTEEAQVMRLVGNQALVADVPTKQYDYLGPYIFSTKTLNSDGVIVWSTQWVRYNPDVQYKFVAPAGLEPGVFSVVMDIDYPLNPLTRAEESVKFLDLIVREE